MVELMEMVEMVEMVEMTETIELIEGTESEVEIGKTDGGSDREDPKVTQGTAANR